MLIVKVVVFVEVLWNISHVGPTFLAILLRSAVWHIWPHYPRARTRGFTDGCPILSVGERSVEAEIGWWWAVEMCDGDNETGLMLVEDFKVW